jgi:thiol:disulfide interchange protein DsbD
MVSAQPPADHERARARLISEQSALVPGTTAWLGLTFDIEPEWHLYWNGYSDTGFPVKMTVTAPTGYSVGDAVWPAPKRHLTENFIDHVYEKQVTLLVPVQVPADAKLDSRATFRVEADWLVCKQACLPGSADLSLELGVERAAAMGTDAARFSAARARVAKPLDSAKPEATITWSSDRVTIRTTNGSKGLAFYPALESAAVTDLSKQGESKTDMIELELAKPGPGDRLVGVLEIGPESGGLHKVLRLDQARSTASEERPASPAGADHR